MPENSAAHQLPQPEVGGEKTPQQVFEEFDARHPKLQGRLAAVESAQRTFWDDVNTGREAAEAAMAAPEAAPVAEPTPRPSRWRRVGATVLSSVTQAVGGFMERRRTPQTTRRHDPMFAQQPYGIPANTLLPVRPNQPDTGQGQSEVLAATDYPSRPAIGSIAELLQVRQAKDGVKRGPFRVWSKDEEAFLQGGPTPATLRYVGNVQSSRLVDGLHGIIDQVTLPNGAPLPVRNPGEALAPFEGASPFDVHLIAEDTARQRGEVDHPAVTDPQPKPE